MAFLRQFGEFLTVKIENMSVQHSSETDKGISPADASKSSDCSRCGEHKDIAVVAVCSGDGISAAFCELGIDRIISGGQTSNPSISDFIEAFVHLMRIQ